MSNPWSEFCKRMIEIDMFKFFAGLIAVTFTGLFLGSVIPVDVLFSDWIVFIVLVVKFFFLFYLGMGDFQEN